MIVRNRLFPFMILIFFSSCVTEKGEVSVKLPGVKTYKDSQIYNATVTNIQIINNQLVITGNNLNIVTNVKTENASKSFVKDFVIESKSNSQIIANSTSPISFAANELFKLVISNSYGAASFDISFNLCNSTLNARALDCTVAANDRDVLSYDATSQTWKPRAVNGLNYLGSFDASSGTAPTAQPSGSYYIISVAGIISGINFEIGDWIVSNGSAYQKIDNSTAITSVFGRTGAVVALEGDYSLDKLLDVDLTVAPVAGKILKYDGTKWVAGDDLSGGGAGSVSSTEISDGAVATVDLANLSVTDAKINDVAAGKITGALTGVQIGAGVITNTHVAAGAAIDYSKLNIPNTTIPYAKLNIAAGEIPQDRINGLTSSLSALIEDVINDAMTTKAPSQNAVYDALSLKADRTNVTQTVTALAVTGLGAPVANSDAANKQYVDTQRDSRVLKIGDTMSGDLTLETNLLLKGGSNYVSIRANAATGNYTLSLPTSAGTNGYVLQTDGTGVLSWVNPSSTTAGAGTVNSAAITDGSIVDADINASANIAQSKISGLTTALSAKEGTITAGTSDQYWRGNKTWSSLQADVQALIMNNYVLGLNSAISNTDSLTGALGKIQAQINATNSSVTSLTTTNVSEGTRLYFTEPRVQQTLLTGLNTSLTGQVVATDNVLQAFGRTQKQINDINTSISGNQWLSSGGNIYRGSGRVGIGTNPSGTLDVNGGTAATGDGEDIILKAQNAGTDSIGGDIHLLTGSKNGTGSRHGRVSIGPTSAMGTPPYELTLMTNGNSYPFSIGVPDGPGFGVSLLLSAGSAGSNASGWGGGDVTIRGGNTYGGAGASKIVFQTAGGGTAGTFQAVTTKMTISGTGEVGIGTTSPATKLHVAGAIKMGPDAGLSCSGTTAGAMRFTTPNVEYCNGTSWIVMGAADEAISSAEITDGTIVDADINASANIAQSKIAGLTTDLANKQALDATLTALSGLDTTSGIMVQNGTDSFIKRTIAGTANRITITNGDGVAGNPTLNIDTNLLPSPTAGGMFLKSTAANTSAWSALTSGEITTALGFTPINKAGDTLSTGNLTVNGTAHIVLPAPTLLTDPTTKDYVDTQIAGAANQWAQSSGNVYRTTGRVGIGTSSPAYDLEVQITETGGVNLKDSAATGGRLFFGEGTSTANLFSPTVLGTSVGVNRSMLIVGEAKVAEDTGSTPVTSFVARRDDNAAIVNRALFDWKNSSTALMTMLANGNLGIGTANPASKLEVAVSTTQPINQTTLLTLRNGSGDFDGNNGPALEFANNIGLAKISGVDERLDGSGEYRGALVFKTRKHTAGSDSGYYERMRLNNVGNLGLGTSVPQAPLDIVKDTASWMRIQQASADTNGPAVGFFKSRGTVAAPAAVNSGDRIMGLYGTGYHSGGAFGGNAAAIQMLAAENFTATAQGSKIDFGTTSIGATARSTRMTIDSTGFVGVGTMSPTDKMTVLDSTHSKLKITGDTDLDQASLFLTELGTIGTESGFELNFNGTNGAGGNSLNFFSYNAGTAINRLSISRDTGNVGIGTTDAAAKLNIGGMGAANATALRIDSQDTYKRDILFTEFNTTAYGGILRYDSGNDLFSMHTIEAGVEQFGLGIKRINGHVGIGIANPTRRLHVSGDMQMDGDVYGGIYGGTRGIWRFDSTNNNFGVFYTEASPDYLDISPSGGGTTNPDLRIFGSGNATLKGTLTQSSDQRLKKNLHPIQNSLERILSLDGIYYQWIDTNKDQKRQIGLIAQNVQKEFPEAVLEGNDGYLSVAYQNLVAPLIEAVKEIYNKHIVELWKENKRQDRAIASIEQKYEKKMNKLENENRALKSDNELMKAYFCQKDPKAPFCKKP